MHLAVSGTGQSPNATRGSSGADFSDLSYGKHFYWCVVETHLITRYYLGPVSSDEANGAPFILMFHDLNCGVDMALETRLF